MVHYKVECLFNLALIGDGDFIAERLECLQLIKSTVPRVEDLVELDYLLGKLIYLLASRDGHVAIVGALGVRAFDLVGETHE